jgi:hypothetical protein
MTFLNILDSLSRSVRQHEENTVNCGTCPVSMACVVSEGGNGWRFRCCGSTGVEVQGLLFVMDCNNNQFEVNKDVMRANVCPLCTGDIIESAVRGNAERYRYVRTVHAVVPLKTRLDVWRARLPKAQAKVREEQQRLGEC